MRRIAVLAVALLAMMIGLWLELRDVAAPVVAPGAGPAPTVARRPLRAAAPVIAVPRPVDVPSTATMPTPTPSPTPVDDPPVPALFDVKTAGNITIAWRTDADVDVEPISPMMVGRIAEGVLEDAADATGTPVRAHLTVVVYPTIGQLRADTHAPAWAGGLYDGAVRVAASRFDHVGVDLPALRHEIMHAQLHAAVGCMPAWLNEGIATYFENNPDVHAMLDVLRDRDLVDVEAMSTPGIQDLPAKHPERLYVESLAMVMYALDHGDGELRTLVARYADARTDQRMAIWTRWFPEARAPQLVDYLARRMFGMATGSALDAILHATVCCAGRHDLAKLACRPPGAPPPDGHHAIWTDRSQTPAALCDAHD